MALEAPGWVKSDRSSLVLEKKTALPNGSNSEGDSSTFHLKTETDLDAETWYCWDSKELRKYSNMEVPTRCTCYTVYFI